MSLRWKIALALATVSFVATAVVGTISYRTTSERLVDEVDSSMAQVTNLVAGSRFGRPFDRGLFNVYDVQYLDRAGGVFASSLEEPFAVPQVAEGVVGRPGAAVRQTVEVDGESHRVHTLGAREGAVQIVRSLDETERVLESVRERTILLVLVVSIGAAGLGWLIAGGVARPLRRLTRAAETVGASGQLDVDLPPAGDDEVGTLSGAFRSMLGALGRSRDAQQRLVQDAGHELRTPLTSLRTNLSVLRRHTELPADTQRQILDDLDSEVSELANLVDELVAAASGRLVEEPAVELSLGEIATEVGGRVGRRHDRTVAVEVRSDPGVMGPPAGVDRAIANLVENACKFDESGAAIDVVVDAGAVRVLDRGPGIDESERSAVFDRFHRADAARAKPGSGLGLSIVRDVIEAHGGEVDVRAREGGGADVGFSLPRV